MNAAINRSERRAFVAQVRMRRALRIFCLVVFASLPFATALGFFVFGANVAADGPRIAAILCGAGGLSLLTLSLVPFSKLPSLANLFTASGLARTERFLGLSGVFFCLAHLGFSFARFPNTVRIVPALGLNFAATIAFPAAAAVLAAIALLWLFADPWRGGRFTLLRAVRFWLTLLIVVSALTQLVFLTETRFPRAALYELAALLVLALAVAFFGLIVSPLRSSRRYRVDSVEPLGAGAVEATFVRMSESSAADYRPGQSAGIAFGGGAFSAKPLFYFSEVSADRIRVAFPSEDGKTALAGSVRPGAEAAFGFGRGAFDMNRLGTDGFVFIVDGFGIAAAVAMLRALAEKRDRREATLIFCESASAPGWFSGELKALKERLRLTVEAIPNPSSVVALIGNNPERYDYFVCGSKAFLTAVKRKLRASKIPAANQWREEI